MRVHRPGSSYVTLFASNPESNHTNPGPTEPCCVGHAKHVATEISLAAIGLAMRRPAKSDTVTIATSRLRLPAIYIII